MAVTDLTGTKWQYNDDIPFTTSGYFAIDFQSAGNSYTSFDYTFMTRPDFARYIDYVDSEGDLTRVYDFSWVNEDYRIINITGGEDVENTDLIAWLEENATQIAEPANPFSFGNLPIENVYFGTQKVKKVYFGNTLVWEKAAEPTPTVMPSKGDIITLDGGTARYRVLGVSGSEALLLAMDDYTSSAYNSSSVTKTFDGGKTGQKYEGSTLDNLLNTTYYNSLSSNVRNAIVDQTRIQRMYSYKNPNDPSYDYHQQYNFDATKMRGLPIEDQTTVGSRHVFALDIKDIFDYLGKDTMTSAELNEMFFEQTTSVGKYVWLSSANSGNSDNAFYVCGYYGYVTRNNYYASDVVRPAFQVDLSKVSWVKE